MLVEVARCFFETAPLNKVDGSVSLLAGSVGFLAGTVGSDRGGLDMAKGRTVVNRPWLNCLIDRNEKFSAHIV